MLPESTTRGNEVVRPCDTARLDEMKVALYALLQLLLASGASGQRMRRPLQEEVAEAIKDGMVFCIWRN